MRLVKSHAENIFKSLALWFRPQHKRAESLPPVRWWSVSAATVFAGTQAAGMIERMRGVLSLVLLIGSGFAVAGFFAQGMARLSGLPTHTTKPAVPVLISTDATAPRQHTNEHSTARISHAGEIKPQAISQPVPAQPAAFPESFVTPQPVLSARHATPPTPRSVAPRSNATESPRLSAAEVRNAQCRSLSAYLLELDSMAQARSDAASQAWIQSQRSTTHDRQTELRC